MSHSTILVLPEELEGIIDKIEIEDGTYITSSLDDLKFQTAGLNPEKCCIINIPESHRLIRLIPKVNK